MDNKYTYLRSPRGPEVRKVKNGYAWTVLVFGIFPMLFRKDWKHALIFFLIALAVNYVATNTIGAEITTLCTAVYWAIIASFYNQLFIKSLLEKGYQQVES